MISEGIDNILYAYDKTRHIFDKHDGLIRYEGILDDIYHNETPVAIEAICDNLLDYSEPIERDVYNAIVKSYEIFELNPKYYLSLRPFVIGKIDDLGLTPLMFACANQRYDTVENLINDDSKVNESDEDGATALYYAVKYSFVDTNTAFFIADLLINHGAYTDVCLYSNGESILMRACQLATANNNFDLVMLLIENGPILMRATVIMIPF